MLLVESLVVLAAARLLVKTTPNSSLVARIGGSRLDSTDSDSMAAASAGGEAPPEAERIGYMVERAAKKTFWRSLCLEKALAGRWMLARRGIASTIYVGMAKDGPDYVAHAWLVGQGVTVTGAGKRNFATLAAFKQTPR